MSFEMNVIRSSPSPSKSSSSQSEDDSIKELPCSKSLETIIKNMFYTLINSSCFNTQRSLIDLLLLNKKFNKVVTELYHHHELSQLLPKTTIFKHQGEYWNRFSVSQIYNSDSDSMENQDLKKPSDIFFRECPDLTLGRILKFRKLENSVEVEGGKGFTLFRLSKNYTFNELESLSHALVDSRNGFIYVTSTLNVFNKSDKVKKTTLVWMSNHVANGTRNKIYNQQGQLLFSKGCQRTTLLGLCALKIICASFGERAYMSKPEVHATCSDFRFVGKGVPICFSAKSSQKGITVTEIRHPNASGDETTGAGACYMIETGLGDKPEDDSCTLF